jgi:hypothetical protein
VGLKGLIARSLTINSQRGGGGGQLPCSECLHGKAEPFCLAVMGAVQTGRRCHKPAYIKNSIISFHFHPEFDGRSEAVEVVKKLL